MGVIIMRRNGIFFYRKYNAICQLQNLRKEILRQAILLKDGLGQILFKEMPVFGF